MNRSADSAWLVLFPEVHLMRCLYCSKCKEANTSAKLQAVQELEPANLPSDCCPGTCWSLDFQKRQMKTIDSDRNATDIFVFEVFMAKLLAWPDFPRQVGNEKLRLGGTLCNGRFCISQENNVHINITYSHTWVWQGTTKGGEGRDQLSKGPQWLDDGRYGW